MRDIRLSKPILRVLEKAQQRKAAEQHKRDVYRQVDVRDGGICQSCGTRCRRTMECVSDRLEHHHLKYRSLGGGHATNTIVTLCLGCHVEAHQHRLIISGNPDEELSFTVLGAIL